MVDDTAAEAQCTGMRCRVQGAGGQGVVIGCDPNTSLYHPNVHLPAVRSAIPAGDILLETEVLDHADS